METVLLQINNHKAYKLLEDLEALNIVKVLERSEQPAQKLSEKYAGKLPADVAEEMQQYIAESRDQWNRNNI